MATETVADDENRWCSRCGHAKKWHTETVIPDGYGAGGYCSWWHDQMFGGTDECSCAGFVEKSGP
jgi:hypothetical protein